ncbi:MAG TPA: glycoside hydrolase family 3 C-terminal domain-containing protein, partial [Clostridia bacterium]|nr:glycoside hydrolase family 3 C-terminal domain-containing protein [Clostridia bacterium]
IGAFAKTPRFQGGGSSHINCFKTESFLDAVAGNAGVAYAEGYRLDTEEADLALVREAVRAARGAGIAVVFAGLPDALESEGYDRAHMRMPANQVSLIEAVAEANPNTVVVLHNGSPVEMPWLPRVRAVIEAYLGGQAVGGAVADVLFGRAEPSGRLPETFPIKLEDNPSYLYFPGNKRRSEYREGVFVGYRYYDKKKMDVLFPFGHGLSYTRFAYSNLRLSGVEMFDTDTLEVEADVTNIGERAGKETVQLYVRNCLGDEIRPIRELRGFEKVSLAPGETKTVRFTLGKRAFAYWDAIVHDWRVESGEYGIELARSSRDILLDASVKVISTAREGERFDLDSIVMDIMADPRAKAVAEPYLKLVLEQFAPSQEESETARSAISLEMAYAMLKYMPLRAFLSFGGGIGRNELLALIDAMNAQ